MSATYFDEKNEAAIIQDANNNKSPGIHFNSLANYPSISSLFPHLLFSFQARRGALDGH